MTDDHDDHPVEPHTHTVTFDDDEGGSHSFTHGCPCPPAEIREGFLRFGDLPINHLRLDGKMVPFDRVFAMLAVLGLIGRLGQSYMTNDNLLTLMSAMTEEVPA